MMHLVVSAARQYTGEAEAANNGNLLRVGGRHDQEHTIGQLFCFHVPVLYPIQLSCLVGNHPLNRRERSSRPCNCHLDATLDMLHRRDGVERYLVHVDQVVTECIQVHLRPVRMRIGFQDCDNLLK